MGQYIPHIVILPLDKGKKASIQAGASSLASDNLVFTDENNFSQG